MEKIKSFIQNRPEAACLITLAIFCVVFLFIGLNSYPLVDVDETRYAVMSRGLIGSGDWSILLLNGVPFTEKPPLYFWLTAFSIKYLGFNEFAVRFPTAILATLIVFFTYFTGKTIISRKFGMYSALILLSTVFFLVLSHVAILDMTFTVFLTAAIYCGLLTSFCKDEHKKYQKGHHYDNKWHYFYKIIKCNDCFFYVIIDILERNGNYYIYNTKLKEVDAQALSPGMIPTSSATNIS